MLYCSLLQIAIHAGKFLVYEFWTCIFFKIITVHLEFAAHLEFVVHCT